MRIDTRLAVEAARRHIDQVLTRYLWGHTLPLVVDNCEHVLDSATAAIMPLLDRAARCGRCEIGSAGRVLAATRARLATTECR